MNPVSDDSKLGLEGITKRQDEKEEPLAISDQLDRSQRTSLQALVWEFADVFMEKPREAQGVEHQILMPKGCIVREHWRWLLRHLYGPSKTK